eukprot:scaffold2579_cov356-Prasinococcus_capsulatus_cf.AAC.2
MPRARGWWRGGGLGPNQRGRRWGRLRARLAVGPAGLFQRRRPCIGGLQGRGGHEGTRPRRGGRGEAHRAARAQRPPGWRGEKGKTPAPVGTTTAGAAAQRRARRWWCTLTGAAHVGRLVHMGARRARSTAPRGSAGAVAGGAVSPSGGRAKGGPAPARLAGGCEAVPGMESQAPFHSAWRGASPPLPPGLVPRGRMMPRLLLSRSSGTLSSFPPPCPGEGCPPHPCHPSLAWGRGCEIRRWGAPWAVWHLAHVSGSLSPLLSLSLSLAVSAWRWPNPGGPPPPCQMRARSALHAQAGCAFGDSDGPDGAPGGPRPRPERQRLGPPIRARAHDCAPRAAGPGRCAPEEGAPASRIARFMKPCYHHPPPPPTRRADGGDRSQLSHPIPPPHAAPAPGSGTACASLAAHGPIAEAERRRPLKRLPSTPSSGAGVGQTSAYQIKLPQWTPHVAHRPLLATPRAAPAGSETPPPGPPEHCLLWLPVPPRPRAP